MHRRDHGLRGIYCELSGAVESALTRARAAILAAYVEIVKYERALCERLIQGLAATCPVEGLWHHAIRSEFDHRCPTIALRARWALAAGIGDEAGGSWIIYVGWELLCAESHRAIGCGEGRRVPADWVVSLQHGRRGGSVVGGACGRLSRSSVSSSGLPRARTPSGLAAGRRRYELLLRRQGHSVAQDDDVNQGGYYRSADPAVTSFDPFSGVARVGFLRHVVSKP